MKKLAFLIVFFITSFFLVSCSSKPSNEIKGTKTEKGDWVYSPTDKKTVQVEQTYYLLQPTWRQSFKFAAKSSGFVFWTTLGFIFLFLAVTVVYSQYSNPSWAPKWFEKWWVHITFILLVIGAACIYSKAGMVRFDNNKWVTKEAYDTAIKETGSVEVLWDKMLEDGLIQGSK